MAEQQKQEKQSQQQAEKNKMFLEMLDPYTRGAYKAMEKKGAEDYASAAEAIGPEKANKNLLAKLIDTGQNQSSLKSEEPPQGQEGMSTMKKLLISLGTGMATAGGKETIASGILDLAKARQKSLNPEMKDILGVDEQGNLTNIGNVPKDTELRTIKSNPTAGLTASQAVKARKIARDLYGVRGAKDGMKDVARLMKEGKTKDQIEDELRFSGQSTKMQGASRSALQSMLIGKSKDVRESTLDYADDLISQGNVEEARDFMKKTARTYATADRRNSIENMETTLSLLDDIEQELAEFEKLGYGTGFWSGNIDNLMAKVGQIKNKEHMALATKIAGTLQEYRKAMTGVQFNERENKDYKKMFPAVNKINELNSANIQGLRELFTNKTGKFYELQMGKKSYNELFKDEQVDAKKSVEVDPEYQQYLDIVGGK